MQHFSYDICLYIIEFAASATFARMARLHKNTRVLDAIARLHNNEFDELLASRDEDNIAYAMTMFDQRSWTLRFCNIELNTISAIKHKYNRIALHFGTLGAFADPKVYKYVISNSLTKWFPNVHAAAPYDNCMYYAVTHRAMEYINEYYDPTVSDQAAALLATVAELGAKCLLKLPLSYGYISTRCRILASEGRLVECRDLAESCPMLRSDRIEVQTALMEHMNDPSGVDKLVSDAIRSNNIDTLSAYVTPIMKHRKYNLICDVVTVNSSTFALFVSACTTAEDFYAVADRTAHMDNLIWTVSICHSALSKGFLDVFNKYWPHGNTCTGIERYVVSAPLASGVLLKMYDKISFADAEVCALAAARVCEAADIVPYIPVLELIDDATLMNVAIQHDNVAIMQYLVKRGAVIVSDGLLFVQIRQRIGKPVTALCDFPKVLDWMDLTLLYWYCVVTNNKELFRKYFKLLVDDCRYDSSFGPALIYSKEGVSLRCDELCVEVVVGSRCDLLSHICCNNDGNMLHFVMELLNLRYVSLIPSNYCTDVQWMLCGMFWGDGEIDAIGNELGDGVVEVYDEEDSDTGSEADAADASW